MSMAMIHEEVNADISDISLGYEPTRPGVCESPAPGDANHQGSSQHKGAGQQSVKVCSQAISIGGYEAAMSPQIEGSHAGHIGARAGKRTTAAATPPQKKPKLLADECEGLQHERSMPTISRVEVPDPWMHYILDENQWIPLWPQFKVAGSKYHFIKVDPFQQWFVHYVELVRQK